MAGSTGPNIVNNGLILNLDAANIKSFRGLSGTNLWYNLNRTFSPSNTSTFKVSYGTEKVYIPYFNGFIDTTYCDIYNDYAGGSGQCCPSPFYYHGPNVTVSGNTQYTYQLIFKTTNGYYSTNYMYRYEFNSSGGYVTEQGVVNASRLEYLGNGWYHAWGQFTTNAATTNITGWLFHYEYLNMNRISIAAVSLTQGSTIHRPEHLINFRFRETRGTTVATGGGWKDLSGNSYDGELVNATSYDSTNIGSMVFDGVNDYISTTLIGVINTMTVECWFKGTSTSRNHLWNFGSYVDNSNLNFNFNDSGYDLWVYWESNGGNRVRYIIDGSFTDSTIKHIVFTHTGSTNKVYLNGVELTITESGGTQTFTAVNNSGYFGIGDVVPFKGNVYNTKVYNRSLTATEILQNYNSQKSRFGL